MTMVDVMVVRIYLTEAEHRLRPLLAYLHDKAHIRGVTVLRGISGFGQSGQMHAAGLVDLSLDLPLVVEFFDSPIHVTETLAHLNGLVEGDPIMTWPAQANR